jgi:hypothetical protein
VTLTDGLFSENLGDTSLASPYLAIPDTIFSTYSTLYLQVTVNGETLLPSKRITATPYALNADSLDGYDSTQVGATSAAALVLGDTGNLILTGNPSGSAIGNGSLYINPATGDVSANDILFGLAVSGVTKYSLDAEGDSVITGDLALNGGDFTTVATTFNLLTTTATTLNFASAATTLKIDDAAGGSTKTINIGGVTGNSPDAISISTEGTQADTIIIGNNNAATLFTLTGGNDWSLDSAGLFTTAGSIAVNGGGVSSTAALALSSSTADISLSPSGGGGAGLVYVTAGDSFVVGNTTTTAPFVITGDTNVMRLGDGVDDANTPTINFYSSNNSASSGALSYLDTDAFDFSGGGFVVNSVNTNSGTSQSFLDNTVTTGDGMTIEVAALTDGNGLIVKRTDGVTNFTGSLMDVQQLDIDPASTGVALRVTQNANNSGCVASPCARGLFIAQTYTTGHIANDSGGSALAIDVNETGSSDDAIVLRAGASTTFRVTTAGDAYADGAFSGSGADLAEYFATNDAALSGGKIVCQDAADNSSVKQCAAGETNPIGVVSTNPAFIGNIIGDGSEDFRHNPKYRLVGLLGQIDTIVDSSGGSINIGDPISTSLITSGHGAKAVSAGRIIGYALEPLTADTGSIRVLVQPQWFSTTQPSQSLATAAEVIADNPITVADNSVSAVTNTSILDIDGSLNMNGGRILSISSLQGLGGNWHLAENGDFTTHGQFIGLINGYSGAPVETYSTMSRQHLIQLSGTSTLENGLAHILFSEVDANFADIISNTSPYRVIATPSGLTGQIYISERDNTGFTIRDLNNSSGVLVDWLVMAYNKDFPPNSAIIEPNNPPPVMGEMEGALITPEVSEPAPDSTDPATETVAESVDELTSVEPPAEPPAIIEEPITEAASEPIIDTPAIVEPAIEPVADPLVIAEPIVEAQIIEAPIAEVAPEPVTE